MLTDANNEYVMYSMYFSTIVTILLYFMSR